MRLRFRIRTAPSAETRSLLDRVVDVEPAGDEVRIGRRTGVEIQLPFETISSLHARVFRHGNGWAVLDMGSVNGTYVGPTRLPSGVSRVLQVGDVLRIADVTITFEGELGAAAPTESKSPGSESTASLARRLVNDLFQSVAGAELARVVVTRGATQGQALALALPDRPYKVGRAADCDLVLDDDDVSREHAAFERRWQGVFVRDLGSKNGIEIDGKRVRSERRVHDGERLVIGSTELQIDDPEERYLRQMDQEAQAPTRSPTPGMPSAVQPKLTSRIQPLPATAAAPRVSLDPAPATAAPVRAPVATAPDPPPAPTDPASDEKTRERPSRLLPVVVSLFALAVLGGVGYLVWVIIWGVGIGSGK